MLTPKIIHPDLSLPLQQAMKQKKSLREEKTAQVFSKCNPSSQPQSLPTKIRNAIKEKVSHFPSISSVFSRIMRSLFPCFYKQKTDADIDGFENISEKNTSEQIIDIQTQNTIDNLRSDNLLSNNTIHTYLKYLQETQELVYENSLLIRPKGTIDIDDFLKKIKGKINQNPEKKIFIPFILENPLHLGKVHLPDHIVTLVISPKEQGIAYYDSQGKSIVNENRNVLGLNIKAKNLFTELLEKLPKSIENNYYGQTTINTRKDQTDHTNCGAYVLHYVQNDGKEVLKNPQEFRNKIADKLEKYVFQQKIQAAGLEISTHTNNIIDFLNNVKGNQLKNINALFRQVDYDIERSKNGGYFIGDNQILSTKDLFHAIHTQYDFSKETRLSQIATLDYMALFQQGVFGNLQEELFIGLNEIFKDDLSINLAFEHEGISETIKFTGDPKKQTFTAVNRSRLYASISEKGKISEKKVPLFIVHKKIHVDYKVGRVTQAIELEKID